jgi:hypothetical protein
MKMRPVPTMLLALASVALLATPARAGTYTGTWKGRTTQHLAIALRVSSEDKVVMAKGKFRSRCGVTTFKGTPKAPIDAGGTFRTVPPFFIWGLFSSGEANGGLDILKPPALPGECSAGAHFHWTVHPG